MNSPIYDKTAKGREEIATRQYHLAPRLRTLLVMVDGRRTQAELLRNVAGLGLNEESLRELLEQQFIAAVASRHALTGMVLALTEPPAAPAPAAPANVEFQSLYEFYNSTIKSTIGLRGFTLQLKVEKAASVDDLRELRRPYLEAVLKAKGSDIARKLAEQLDQLIGVPSPFPFD